MDIGVGLPNAIAGVSGSTVLEWAVEAERAGFSSVASTDRLIYDNYECLTTLAAAAAVTERVGLVSSILLGPLRTNTVVLAKQAASIDKLSGGRLTLGIAAGSRPDDFNASGVPMKGRGAALAAQVEQAREIWAGKPLGFAGAAGPEPTTEGGPRVLLGGHSPAAIARAARIGDGWISGGGGVGMFTGGANAFRGAWRQGERVGKPRIVALAYFALGPNAEQLAGDYLGDYYSFAPPYAQVVLNNSAVGAAKLREQLAGYADAGCDEVLFSPCDPSLDQLKALADLVL